MYFFIKGGNFFIKSGIFRKKKRYFHEILRNLDQNFWPKTEFFIKVAQNWFFYKMGPIFYKEVSPLITNRDPCKSISSVCSCKISPSQYILSGGRLGDWLGHTFVSFVTSHLPSIGCQLWTQAKALWPISTTYLAGENRVSAALEDTFKFIHCRALAMATS